MAVVSAGGQQRGEGDLVHHRTPGVGQALRQPDRADQVRGQHHPADAQSRRQCLARRADVDHPVRRDALQCADGRPVVAVFGVVVVLDDQMAGARPFHERGAPGGREHHAGRRLVCGVVRTVFAPLSASAATSRPSSSTGTAIGSIPLCRNTMPVQPESGVLHGQRQLVVLQRAPEQCDRLRRARTEHDVLRIGLHAAGAPEIVGDGGARHGQTLRFDVSERLRTDLGEAGSQRAQPRGAGKAAEIR